MKTFSMVCAITGVFLRPLAIQLYWGWFATPVFGITPPSLVSCYGLLVLFGLLNYSGDVYQKDGDEAATTRGIVAALYPLIAIAIGYFLVWVR